MANRHIGRKTTCSKCGAPLDGAGRYCKACRKAYNKVYNKLKARYVPRCCPHCGMDTKKTPSALVLERQWHNA